MKLNLSLIKHHGFSLSEIENMLPWERLVYIDMIAAQMAEEAKAEVDRLNQQKDLMSLKGRI